ncbi:MULTISPECIES: hypothetical protein, partial [unclassified Mesorhizobium]|uniref:hypothetical protein n=1 Tax=unclassified Mesorhizobium TaxID=325217 RepID=UPI002476264E
EILGDEAPHCGIIVNDKNMFQRHTFNLESPCLNLLPSNPGAPTQNSCSLIPLAVACGQCEAVLVLFFSSPAN